jgi:hypothetical protein
MSTSPQVVRRPFALPSYPVVYLYSVSLTCRPRLFSSSRTVSQRRGCRQQVVRHPPVGEHSLSIGQESDCSQVPIEGPGRSGIWKRQQWCCSRRRIVHGYLRRRQNRFGPGPRILLVGGPAALPRPGSGPGRRRLEALAHHGRGLHPQGQRPSGHLLRPSPSVPEGGRHSQRAVRSSPTGRGGTVGQQLPKIGTVPAVETKGRSKAVVQGAGSVRAGNHSPELGADLVAA